MVESRYLGLTTNGLAKIASDLAVENQRLREAVATAIKVQAVLCGEMDMPRCRQECPLHRSETDDCLACEVIKVAREVGIEL